MIYGGGFYTINMNWRAASGIGGCRILKQPGQNEGCGLMGVEMGDMWVWPFANRCWSCLDCLLIHFSGQFYFILTDFG